MGTQLNNFISEEPELSEIGYNVAILVHIRVVRENDQNYWQHEKQDITKHQSCEESLSCHKLVIDNLLNGILLIESHIVFILDHELCQIKVVEYELLILVGF